MTVALAVANLAHQPGLADTLHNLGYNLGSLGRSHDAGMASGEEVSVYGQLAGSRPQL
jgi:hypothetical protein